MEILIQLGVYWPATDCYKARVRNDEGKLRKCGAGRSNKRPQWSGEGGGLQEGAHRPVFPILWGLAVTFQLRVSPKGPNPLPAPLIPLG